MNLLEQITIHKSNYQILRREGLLEEINDLTEFLNEHYVKIKLRQRIWHIKNQKYEIQKCGVCKTSPAKFHKSHGYVACSSECLTIKKSKVGIKAYKENKDTIIDKIKKTCLKKYGVEHHSQSQIVKNKIIKTNLERYGVEHVAQDQAMIQAKKETCRIKYGGNSSTCDPKIRAKQQETCLQNLGVNNPAKSKKVRDKIIKTNLERYGTTNAAESDTVKNKIRDRMIEVYGDHSSRSLSFKTKIDKYFVDKLKLKLNGKYLIVNKQKYGWELQHISCHNKFVIGTKLLSMRMSLNHEICLHCNKLNKNYSVKEKLLASYIKSIYGGFMMENNKKLISPYEIDIYLPDLKIAVEFNGTHYHADPRFYDAEDKIVGYKTAIDVWNRDAYKSIKCSEIGVSLITIWEHDWDNDIENIKSMLFKLINSLQ
jgi:very-short-patch-repair endonuclease